MTAYDNWLTEPQDRADQAQFDAEVYCLSVCDVMTCDLCGVEGVLHDDLCRFCGDENPNNLKPLVEVETPACWLTLCADCEREAEEEQC